MKTLPSGLPDIVGEEEELARFLTQSGHFNARMAKPAAFLPNPKDRETSVYRHGYHPSDQLWEIGRSATIGRNLYGVAIITAKIVGEAELEVKSNEPPPRHAVIRGWPWLSDPELQRAQQKEKAIILASQSNLFLRPS